MNPKVTIAMAIYKPKLEWLYEQLQSLNEQTYENIELLVWNDCPEDSTDYQVIFTQFITAFPFRIYTGERNLGSNGAFEELTKLVDSPYIAYCDQDDIWLAEKIATLVLFMEKSNADLVCSDMYVIDGQSKVVADSILKVRPRQKFYEGSDQFRYLLSKNFVTGCTTLVRTAFARSVLPFSSEYVHDWWLAIYAAYNKRLAICRKPLIKYRIHGGNQTGILAGVVDKKSYYEKRIVVIKDRGLSLCKRFPGNSYVEVLVQFAVARDIYYKAFSVQNALRLWRMRSINKMTALFELFLPFMPRLVFQRILHYLKAR